MKFYNRPVGITILAILGYVGAGMLALFGLLAIVAGPFLINLLGETEFSIFLKTASVLLGIVFIILALIQLVIARGLWNGKNWARLVTLIFSIISVFGSLFNFPESIFSLVFYGFVIWYLVFRKEVKRYFE